MTELDKNSTESEKLNTTLIREALERILRSAPLQNSERMRSFLTYVVNETIEGRAARIKSFTISVEVFDRSHSQDASGESVVRTTANRLRAALDRYYSGPGTSDPVIISLPKGRYVPQFALAAAQYPAVTNTQISPPPVTSRRSRDSQLVLGAIAVLVALGAVALGLAYQARLP